MIIKRPFEKGLFDRPGVDTRYFGKDAEDFLESINWHSDINYLGKECVVNGRDKGIIVGIEDSESYDDYYYIVFIPETGEVTYPLANDAQFIGTIEV